MNEQVRVLLLKEGQHQDGTLYRVEKGWTLQFILEPLLYGKRVRLFCNHPANPKDGYNSDKFQELIWENNNNNQLDECDLFTNLLVIQSGPFHFYFTVDTSDKKENASGSGYFLVDAHLIIGSEEECLPLDCIQCQTYLSKLLGPFNEWESRLLVGKETGYNMIHFTPIQELGASNSSYSIADQLKLNHIFSPANKKYTFDDVEKLFVKMKKEWKVLSVTDIVLNHTAYNSPWIKEHPECGYNLKNSPYLRPAFILDCVIHHLTIEIAQGKWEDRGIPVHIDNEYHLMAIRAALNDVLLPRAKIEEFFLMDVDAIVTKFKENMKVKPVAQTRSNKTLTIIQDPLYRRRNCTINMDLAVQLYNIDHPGSPNDAERVNRCCNELRNKLNELNDEAQKEACSHVLAGVENVIAGARYQFVQHDGPRTNAVTAETPLVPRYFTQFEADISIEEEEKLMYLDKGQMMMALNGWVMNDDALRNFADSDSNVYLRRELICWGDSVKLRYGESPKDCPYLWKHMTDYACITAKLFHGIRLDNCHGTPLHVAEYLLSQARKVRPDLYVVAELFTRSEETDNIFMNKLGINSLIREAMSAGDSHEEGRLVYRYGGEPVGAFIHLPVRPLTPSIAHAMFLDLTHDNPSPVEVRSVYDLLPSAALVSMACCAIGSNRGYDELVPHHIHVVSENRFYPKYSDNVSPERGSCSLKTGIIAGKRALNRLHQELGAAGFTEVYVDQVDENIVAVTRHCPANHQSVILVSRTAFSPPNPRANSDNLPPLCVPGIVEEIILEARLIHKPTGEYSKDPQFVNGLADYHLDLREHIQLYESDMVELSDSGESSVQQVDFTSFPPGSVVAFRVSLNSNAKSAILQLRTCLNQFGYRVRSYSGSKLRQVPGTDIGSIASRLNLADLYRILYRCNAEESDEGKGGSSYYIPGYGDLIYCGLQGCVTLLKTIHLKNDLGHPMCDNLRNGDWLPGYLSSRLIKHPSTKELGLWFDAVFEPLSEIPRYLIPCYFDAIVTGAYLILINTAWKSMSDFVKDGSSFIQALALGSIQLCGVVKSAPLPGLSPNISPPHPPHAVNEVTGRKEQACVTMAAGLPHFATGVMRNWGRDTFIALPGLMLLVGRYQEARYIILSFAGCLRHGLIPNLLGGGKHARFNCRDSIWWWLQSIQIYCNLVPDGHKILKDRVSRIFPLDDSLPEEPGFADQLLEEVIQEALQKHVQGVQYRERHAGTGLDNDMSDEGFNNNIGVDLETGFVFGGNINNCGTWMDKMGSSDRAGNRGKPATPRDGSAIELVGLCKSALRWLIDMNKQGLYPYDSIKYQRDGSERVLTLKEWNQKIQDNFEKVFWISSTPTPNNEPRPDLIHRRGMYKDSFNASQFWADFQLRPNFAIAMVVAMELFTPKNAWTALQNAQEVLLGPLGMKTLDPKDWAYNGNYINSDNSNNYNTSRGFNYHQGPEWLWPVGFFLRAKLKFAQIIDQEIPGTLEETISFVKLALGRHRQALSESLWEGLPELTNENGANCSDSCPIQAWTMSCLLEVLFDLEQIGKS